MSHKEVLKALFPVELGGVFDQDITVEGAALDEVYSRMLQLLDEIFPDAADELIPDWERVCGLTPGLAVPLQLRRDNVVAKLREIGRLDKQFFIDVAAALGATITIEELDAGQDGYGPEGIFVWRVNISAIEETTYYFRAGESSAGDYLMWWNSDIGLEEIFEELKPAHTLALFVYP